MKKISKKLRGEAIELAGIRATFWANDIGSPGSGVDTFGGAARRLVEEARSSADIDFGPFDSFAERMTLRAAEAQAMLLEGWSPS